MKRLKLACADFTFPLLSHENSLQLISMLEFQGVDIGLFEGRSHLWPSKEFKSLKKSARLLKKKVKNLGLKVADVFLQLAPDFVPSAINHPQARLRRKARDLFLRTLEYAAECGAEHVTTLPGVQFKSETKRESLLRCIEELSWRVEQSKAHGIVFAIEAHIGSIVPKPKSAEALVQAVPGLTLTLDYTHFTRIGMRDSQVECLLKHASHFHVRGALKGRLQASFQDNTIDYRRVVKKLGQAKYRGWVGVEYVWIDWEHCNECDNLAETIQFRDFLRSLN